jgi:uracil-DNA glycosylase
VRLAGEAGRDTVDWRDDDEVALALASHREALGACRRCALGPGVRPVTSHARAPRVMLVGQAPGHSEMSNGRAFTGRAGRTLFRWLADAGLDEAVVRERVYIAAVTRCYPGPHSSGRGDRLPTPAERSRCRPWLEAELRLVRPALLVLVGRLAITELLGGAPLDEVVGRVHELTHAGGRSRVVPLPHPSGASSWVHQGSNRALLDAALRLLAREAARAGLPTHAGRDRRGVA